MRLIQILLFLLTFALGITAAANGQECPAGGCAQAPAHAGMHAAMAPNHAQMMAHMQAADAKLESLVADMNAASGEARSDAMAALLTELVAQRKAMCAHMMEMMHGGGGHGTPGMDGATPGADDAPRPAEAPPGQP